jgi:hypothetical protein
MATKAVWDAVKARQAANWTTLPVYYANEATQPPADLSGFVVVETPIGRSSTISLGPSRGYREEGGFRFVIHVPLGSGAGDAFTYADALAALYRGKTLSAGLETLAPGPAVPLGDDGAYYKVSFSVPYRYLFSA